MACRAPPLSAALHADLGELAVPRRALVCRADAEAAAARRAPLGARAQHRQLTSTAARFPGTWSAIRWPTATVTTSKWPASRSPSTTSATAPASFVDCTACNGLAEKVVLPHVKKGAQVFIQARVETRMEDRGENRQRVGLRGRV